MENRASLPLAFRPVQEGESEGAGQVEPPSAQKALYLLLQANDGGIQRASRQEEF